MKGNNKQNYLGDNNSNNNNSNRRNYNDNKSSQQKPQYLPESRRK